uniref:Uncharacterized protein n=1 Tax=Aeromonas salmonicida subsp. salmonicida TaxID=29491 RepID=A0A1Z3MNP9_AERSS|nr:hypothetical protein [Aeromonas salmonicida subsp. salmonicida]
MNDRKGALAYLDSSERDRLWTGFQEGIQKLWAVSFEHGYNFGHPIRTK